MFPVGLPFSSTGRSLRFSGSFKNLFIVFYFGKEGLLFLKNNISIVGDGMTFLVLGDVVCVLLRRAFLGCFLFIV